MTLRPVISWSPDFHYVSSRRSIWAITVHSICDPAQYPRFGTLSWLVKMGHLVTDQNGTFGTCSMSQVRDIGLTKSKWDVWTRQVSGVRSFRNVPERPNIYTIRNNMGYGNFQTIKVYFGWVVSPLTRQSLPADENPTKTQTTPASGHNTPCYSTLVVKSPGVQANIQKLSYPQAPQPKERCDRTTFLVALIHSDPVKLQWK